MKNNITKFVSIEDCCGCGACANKCSVHAISMQENEEGFLNPVINEDSCINCSQCLKVCPILNDKKENIKNPECYAVAANDSIRLNSSSGGLFTLLAEYILKQNGVVCGAAFDDEWNVHHIIIDKLNDIHKLRGSKYVQSSTEYTFTEIQSFLKKEKMVLFCGTPCQVAGLNTFLDKNYDNLITMDILCHGAPSRSVWKKYLSDNIFNTKIKNINFRDKTQIGWSCSHCTITLEDDRKIVSDEYTKLFHQSIILNKACQNCKFSKLSRPADITGGDWWGISKYDPNLNDGKGLSFVLLNTIKGKKVFENIKEKMIISQKIDLSDDYNNGYIRHNEQHNLARAKFFFNYKNLPLNKASEIAINNKYDVCLVSIFYGLNYGTILVSHAVNKIIKDLGYSILMLNKPSYIWRNHPTLDSISGRFGLKYYNISRVYNSPEDLIHLNKYCDKFVVGSDQMFTPILGLSQSFLDFVELDKNKISFGTSFGRVEYNKLKNDIDNDNLLLNRFNHIALREKCPELCENMFNLQDAIEVMDPTLMINVDYYKSLAKGVILKEAEHPYILAYMLDLNKNKIDVLKYISKKLKLKLILIQNLDKRHIKIIPDLTIYKDEYTPEEFLYLYENASFVVTDSYHGTCFAIKFNKQFISIVNRVRGGLRYKLFDELGVSHKLVDNVDDIYNSEILFEQFDFDKTNAIIKEKSIFAIKWLKKALEDNNTCQKFSKNEIYLDKKIKNLSLELYNVKNKTTTESIIEKKRVNLGIFNFVKKIEYKIKMKLYKGEKKEKYRKKYEKINH